jgi:hypothetical protein
MEGFIDDLHMGFDVEKEMEGELLGLNAKRLEGLWCHLLIRENLCCKSSR